jgi:hypothetical protein
MIAIATKPPPDEPDFPSFSLIPVNAAGSQVGDAIPLRKKELAIGQAESCDIVLRSSVSVPPCLCGYIFP